MVVVVVAVAVVVVVVAIVVVCCRRCHRSGAAVCNVFLNTHVFKNMRGRF